MPACCSRRSERANQKLETRNQKQAQNPKLEKVQVPTSFWISDFGFDPDFWFRHSGFSFDLTDNPFMPVLRALASPSPSSAELRRILHLSVPVIVKLAERKL